MTMYMTSWKDMRRFAKIRLKWENTTKYNKIPYCILRQQSNLAASMMFLSHNMAKCNIWLSNASTYNILWQDMSSYYIRRSTTFLRHVQGIATIYNFNNISRIFIVSAGWPLLYWCTDCTYLYWEQKCTARCTDKSLFLGDVLLNVLGFLMFISVHSSF